VHSCSDNNVIQILLVLHSNNTLAVAEGTKYEITFEAKCKFIRLEGLGVHSCD
jgi:hypothetical protein